MHFEVRLISIWKTLALSIILMTMLFVSTIILFKGHSEYLIIVLGFPLFFVSFIISIYLSSRTKNIDINNGILTVDKSNPIIIEDIEWYNASRNFLLDGIRIKTKKNKNYYFSTINLINKDPNFDFFKNILINKTLDHKIQEKTTQQLFIESKSLRYGSTILLIGLVIIVILSFVFNFKLDGLKLFYWSMIALSYFIYTRK